MRLLNLLPGIFICAALVACQSAHAEMPLADISADWATRALADSSQLDQDQPDLAASIRTGEPRLSRSGAPLFLEPAWRTPEAAGALLVRLSQGDDSTAERIGLIDALTRTGGDWADALVGLLAAETEPSVRRMMVESLSLAPLESARKGIRMGLDDDASEVRAAALRVVASHPRGAELGSLAVKGLSDRSPRIREEAARSIGYAGYTDGFDAMRPLLEDADAAVRFRALRSLEKLDIVRLQQLPELNTLATDADLRVAREAQKVQLY
jgi:HEAT repeat protein